MHLPTRHAPLPTLFLSACLAAFGCGDSDGGTRIVVVVDSDIGAQDDPHLTAVDIEVEGTQMPAGASADLVQGDPLPRQLTLLYGGGSRGPLRITATGTLSDGGELSQSRGEVFFEEGAEVRVSLDLDAACLGQTCSEGQTCIRGECRGEATGSDDGGVADAGVDASAEAGMDASAEAGMDASADGGTDAGLDGGQCESDCGELDEACGLGVCNAAASMCVVETVSDGSECTDGLCVAGSCEMPDPCAGGDCAPSCRGVSDCVYGCAGATRCTPDCNGSSCVVDCRGADDCGSVRCRKGECLVLCEGATSCAFGECAGAEASCNDGDIIVCGRDCP